MQKMKKKYGEITMLDFPHFTKEPFPGVTHMDLFSGLFGDVTDDSMYVADAADGERPDARHSASSTLRARPGKKVARKHGQQNGDDRDKVPSHFEQRAARHLRSRCGEAQGRHRGGEEVAGRRGDAGREIDAREQRRPADRAVAGCRPQSIRKTTSLRNI